MLTQDDIDHLRGWIGRGETLSGTLSQELVDRFRASFDMPEGGLEKKRLRGRAGSLAS